MLSRSIRLQNGVLHRITGCAPCIAGMVRISVSDSEKEYLHNKNDFYKAMQLVF